MEGNKKNYLFKLGPLLFFPRQTEEEKQQTYQDNKAFDWNIFRLAIIMGYGLVIFILTSAADIGRMFMEPRPLSHYLVFAVPLVLSIMDWRVIRKEKKTGIPISRTSRYLIYGVWLVSVVYYSIYIYHYL